MRDLELYEETHRAAVPGERHEPAPALDLAGVGNAAVARQLMLRPSRFRAVVPPGAMLARAPADDQLPGFPRLPQFPAGPKRPLGPEEKEFLAELRRKTGNSMDRAYTTYALAAEDVKKEQAEKKKEPDAGVTFLLAMIELAVGSLAPGLVGFALGPLRKELQQIAGVVIDRLEKDADKQVSHFLTAEALVDKYVTNEAGAGHALNLLKGAWGQTQVRPDLPVGPMLDAFVQEFNEYVHQVDGTLAAMSPDDLVAAYAAYHPSKCSREFYKRQITDLLEQHQALDKAAAPPQEGSFGGYADDEQIVIVHAFGVSRPAIVNPPERSDDIVGVGQEKQVEWGAGKRVAERKTAPAYRLLRWVPDDMAEKAKSRGAEQTGRGKDGSGVETHVGLVSVADSESYSPERDAGVVMWATAPWQGRRYAEIIDGERTRLATVEIDADHTPKFIAWVEPPDEHYARAKGEQQYGGLKRIDAKQLGELAARQAAREAASAVGQPVGSAAG